MEEQRAYLGGDAEHSVLVKGLDFALLARRKAELEAVKAENMEDELDQMGAGLGGARPRKETSPKDKASKVGYLSYLTAVQVPGAEEGGCCGRGGEERRAEEEEGPRGRGL